jgi:hypothetical protein
MPSDCQILPRAFAIQRSPNEEQLERGFALIEDLAPRGLMPDLYEGLRPEQASQNHRGNNFIFLKVFLFILHKEV